MTWIQTRSGKRLDLTAPRAEDIDPMDIAYSLSKLCRFNGHTLRFYSVAQHSVILSEQVSPEAAFYGLMHDAAEAYIGDIATPLKTPEIKAIEARIFDAIAESLPLLKMATPEIRAEVKVADLRMLATEKVEIMGPGPKFEQLEGIEPYPIEIECWGMNWAARRFRDRMFEVIRWA